VSRGVWLVAALCWAAAVSCGPWERTPGFRLFGEVVREPITDWSFVKDYGTIAVETRTRYGIPHSVTTVSFSFGGNLYVPSRNPRGKRWVANVLRDPRVRLRIGDKIYERKAVHVTDPTRVDDLLESLAARYPRLRPSADPPELWLFRMDPREGS
jgi:hypothetical protein